MENVIPVALIFNSAVPHDDHIVGHISGNAEIVGDHENVRAVFLPNQHHLTDDLPPLHVETEILNGRDILIRNGQIFDFQHFDPLS